MTPGVRRSDYFYLRVEDRPGEAYKILSQLAELGINLLAFTAVPTGPDRTQLTVFPEDPLKLQSEARRIGMTLDGPHHAFLAQGQDEIGVLATLHEQLYRADVNVYASTGVSDGSGRYGYVIYVRPEDVERAAAALGAR